MFNSMSGDAGNLANHIYQFAEQLNATNIDWAQLAQQWIVQNSGDVTPPPPPDISNNGKGSNKNSSSFEEKGEADMDMDDMEEVPPAPPMLLSGNINDGTSQWFTEQNDVNDTWNVWPNTTIMPTQFSKPPHPTSHIPSLMKINVPNPNELSKNDNGVSSSSNTTVTLDAAKRKVLPAWIREGLEKMEREKLKQLERDQQLKERGHSPKNLGLNDENMVNPTIQASDDDESSINDVVTKTIVSKSSKINTDDGADDDDEDDTNVSAASVSKSYEQKLADLMVSVRRTLTELLLEVTNEEIAHIAHDTLNSRKLKGLAAYSSSGESDSDDSAASGDNRTGSAGTNTAGEDSEEEIKNKLRMRRRAFAKISDEIEERIAANAVREEQKLKYYKQKELEQQQKQQQKYLDNFDSEDSDDDGHRNHKKNLELSGLGKNYSRDFGETTTDSKLQSSNGKRAKERGVGGGGTRRGERTTRFSDNKDSKSISAATANYITQFATATTSTAAAINKNLAATSRTPTIPQYPISNSSTTNMPETMTKYQTSYTPTNTAAAAGINTMLNAADAALEKAAAKTKMLPTSSSSRRYESDRERERDRRRQRDRHDSRRHTSDESDNSSDSSNTSRSTNSSRHSKYSRASSSTSKHKHSNSSSRNKHSYYDDRYYSSSSRSRHTSERTSSSSKHSRHDRSRSRDRHRDRSRSRSTYSSTSSKRNRH